MDTSLTAHENDNSHDALFLTEEPMATDPIGALVNSEVIPRLLLLLLLLLLLPATSLLLFPLMPPLAAEAVARKLHQPK